MHLTEEDIKEFQALYKKHFGMEISHAQAHEEGLKLVVLMKSIYKPIPRAALKRQNAEDTPEQTDTHA